MPPENTPSPEPPSTLRRVWRSIRREPLWPEDERGRVRLAASDLILHLHPPRVPARSLRLTYTFGLGGMAILLLVVQVLTGVLLMFAYTPSPEAAYNSLVALQTEVYFGQLIRNLHHWSANLLLIVVFLHLLRVFYTAAFRHPRQFNWQLGLALLGLAVVANFTGYLLPWDQLSYWAVTVGTSLISYIPLVGEPIKRLLLGGPEVNATTLSNFYALHVMLIPLGFLVTGAFHIWRVRKDKFTIPRRIGEEPTPRRLEMVTTIPHLVAKELIVALVVLALLLTWSTFVDAPLLDAADPNQPPNPTRAAWYFLGIQELLLHFHPTFGAFLIPAITIGALIALPYLRDDADTTGIWFRSWRGRWLAVLSLVLGAGATAALVILAERGLTPQAALPFLPAWLGNGLIPLGVAMLAVYGYARAVRRLGANPGETRLAIFTLLLAVFLTLTAIGLFFRGPDMALVLPWEAAP